MLALKRLVDVLLAATLLIATLPLMSLVALTIAWSMGRPILFRQRRPGQSGRIFELIKFRTMTEERDAHGNPLADGQRLTRVGSFLRRTSLDELPELWNVLRGDMSVVGPRPLLTEYLDLYTDEQRRRHSMRPGLTGWAQVNGRNALDWDKRLEMDVWYVDHWSMLLDVRIICRSVGIVLRGEGVCEPGYATGRPFEGSRRKGAAPRQG